MASMILASSPLSVQSFVKLRTNSNYSHSPCYVSRAKNSYIHLPYKNISNIQSSKSLFTKGDGNFSFSSTKFPRVASKSCPSLNIIKAYSEADNIYHYFAHDVRTGQDIQLGDKYRNQILLIVNLPQKLSSENARKEIKFLNDLRNRYIHQPSVHKADRSFEVLGFFPPLKESILPHFLRKEEKYVEEEEQIQELADFPIFRKGGAHDKNDGNFWKFLRKVKENEEMEEEFEKYVVNGDGICLNNFPWFEGETLKGSEQDPIPGGNPGSIPGSILREDPRYSLENAIAKHFLRRDYTNY